MKYKDEITEMVKEIINLKEPIESIKVDTNLQSVGMDSIAFIKIVIEIENHFDIEFPDEKLLITQAGTIKDLCEIIMGVKGENE
jgi:acyl carrier protein